MNQTEFINAALGVSWVNRGRDYSGMDCHGLNFLYYRDVLGVNISLPDGYLNGDSIEQCWEEDVAAGKWEEVSGPSRHGVVFTCYKGKRPMHVGICLNETHAIHCRGGFNTAGAVEIHSLRALERMLGKMTYHVYRGLDEQS